MTRKCVALLSGGLDSKLAIRIMQERGIDVEALNFKTIFTCCQDLSAQAARELKVPITVLPQEDDYLELIKRPAFGYGKGANPCVDCRIYMFRKAKVFMEQIGADFLVSGEVVGQRPMSQKRKELRAISYHSDPDDLLLRPLSAKLMPPTLPEREGWVDRESLYAFYGRGRKGLIKLARELGINDIPSPSTGCALTEPLFGRKVHDLVRWEPHKDRWDFELLKVGRHFRLDASTKVIVGRRAEDNAQLEYLHDLPDASSTTILIPEQFQGPTALIVGPHNSESVEFAVGLIARYGRIDPAGDGRIVVRTRDQQYEMDPQANEQSESAVSLVEAK